MLSLGIYELTHPESLSEVELKEILKNRCIDFSNYKSSSKSELIELYKRVALPLPQRQSEDSENLDIKREDEATSSINEAHRNSISSNGVNSMKTARNQTIEESKPVCTRSKSTMNELTPKRTYLHKLSNTTKCNSIDKRTCDEKHDGAPLKKRQKITWP
ncbi:hypothetical protein ANTQUA_LOCUS765 [Anthophora quadrimaculata]